LVLCAHGIRGGVGTVAEHAGMIQRLRVFSHVWACCHKGWPGLAETLAACRGERVYLVPMLMAEGFTLRAMQREIPTITDRESRPVLCRPIGTHPELAHMIVEQAEDACAAKHWPANDTALLLVGHGTRRDPNSDATTKRHATTIAGTGRFAEVATAFLDQEPKIDAALRALRAPHCVVSGLFIDRGEHGEEDVPAILRDSGSDAVYAGPIGTDRRMVELILAQVRAASHSVVAETQGLGEAR